MTLRDNIVIRVSMGNISVWICINDVIELPLYSALSGRLFLAKSPKMTIQKLKRKVSPFFLLLHVNLRFIAILSLFFARLHSLEAA